MRTAFVQALCDLADRDPRVVLLTADLGWSVLEKFGQRFPGRFMNVGVAEQNMLGIAAGLALDGHVPFVYSIATFASMRCYEQFRNGAVLHNLPVRVVGTGGGFAYGHAGPTHHAIEDLSIARALPGVAVLAPADGAQAKSVIEATYDMPGPCYLRIDKSDQPDIVGLGGRFALDQPLVVREGRDVLLLCAGSITQEAMQAAERLAQSGTSAAVAVMAHLSLAGSPALTSLLSRYREVVTVEEGTIAGGLGSLAAETIADHALPCRLVRLGVRSSLHEHFGGRIHLLRAHGLDTDSIVKHATPLPVKRMAA